MEKCVVFVLCLINYLYLITFIFEFFPLNNEGFVIVLLDVIVFLAKHQLQNYCQSVVNTNVGFTASNNWML